MLGVLFIYGVARGYYLANPIKQTAKAKEVDRPPGILSAAQAANLLAHAGLEILPAVVIGLFAGLRPESETWKLRWEYLDFESRLIDVAVDRNQDRPTPVRQEDRQPRGVALVRDDALARTSAFMLTTQVLSTVLAINTGTSVIGRRRRKSARLSGTGCGKPIITPAKTSSVSGQTEPRRWTPFPRRSRNR